MGIKLAERAHIIEVVRASFIYTISVLIVLLQAKCCRSGMPKKRGNNQIQNIYKIHFHFSQYMLLCIFF